jgi:hypothetical protein
MAQIALNDENILGLILAYVPYDAFMRPPARQWRELGRALIPTGHLRHVTIDLARAFPRRVHWGLLNNKPLNVEFIIATKEILGNCRGPISTHNWWINTFIQHMMPESFLREWVHPNSGPKYERKMLFKSLRAILEAMPAGEITPEIVVNNANDVADDGSEIGSEIDPDDSASDTSDNTQDFLPEISPVGRKAISMLDKLMEYENDEDDRDPGADIEILDTIMRQQHHISEDLLELIVECLKTYDAYKKSIWKQVLQRRQLSHRLLRKFADDLPWKSVSAHQMLTSAAIREFADRLDWEIVTVCQLLSSADIREFADKLDWDNMAKIQCLEPDIIAEFADKLTWFDVVQFQELTKEQKKEYHDYLPKYTMLGPCQ